MRRITIFLLASLLALGIAGPASGIVGGELDGDDHPNVGALVLVDIRPKGVVLLAFCSGTLVESDVFLTAGHCLPEGLPFADELAEEGYEIDELWVSFDSSAVPGEDLIGPIAVFENYIKARSWTLNPGYPGRDAPFNSTFVNNDLGIVELRQPASRVYPGIEPATLPPAGYLDGVEDKRAFTLVGFGTYRALRPLSGDPTYDGARRRAAARLVGMGEGWFGVRGTPMSESPEDSGVACPGDSGGAVFHGGYLVGVISGGDVECRQHTFAPRLDAPIARNFLGPFGIVPD